MTILTEMKFKRLQDDLQSSGPVTMPRARPNQAGVLAEAGPTIPRRRMLQPYHVGGQFFLITPGWLCFQEAQYQEDPLSAMEPHYWEDGTKLVIECRVRWEFLTVPHYIDGSPFYYKSGRFDRPSLRVLDLAPGVALPADSTPPDETSLPELITQDLVRHFLLGTIGELTVSGNGLGGLTLGVGAFAYDITTIP